jgi:hypothetical protein
MRRLLRAAERAGHVTPGRSDFWVTEFSWDTNPPDPEALPIALHPRYVAEALYQMWRSDVSLVTWLGFRDQRLEDGVIQSGLYFRGRTLRADRPKPFVRVFRFPFVSYQIPRATLVWGRTPTRRGGPVYIEERVRRGWSRLGVVRANGHGIFLSRLPPRASGALVRARASGETAVPFSLIEVPDRFFNPFGSKPRRPPP